MLVALLSLGAVPVLDGGYTEAQSNRGQMGFCHGDMLTGSTTAPGVRATIPWQTLAA
jgi:hypothetical protein